MFRGHLTPPGAVADDAPLDLMFLKEHLLKNNADVQNCDNTHYSEPETCGSTYHNLWYLIGECVSSSGWTRVLSNWIPIGAEQLFKYGYLGGIFSTIRHCTVHLSCSKMIETAAAVTFWTLSIIIVALPHMQMQYSYIRHQHSVCSKRMNVVMPLKSNR